MAFTISDDLEAELKIPPEVQQGRDAIAADQIRREVVNPDINEETGKPVTLSKDLLKIKPAKFTITDDPADAKHDASEYEAPPIKSLKRRIGRNVRGAIEAGLTMATGALGGIAGLGGEAYQLARHEATTPRRAEKLMEPGAVKETIQQAMTYQPRTEKGKEYVQDIATPESLLNPLTYVKALSDVGESIKDQVDSPEAKAAVDLTLNAASMALPKVAGAITSAPKYLMSGSETARKTARENIAAFKKEGITPSLGQVSAGGATKGAGGSEALVAEEAPKIAAQATKLADKLSPITTSEEAGNVIHEAIMGKPVTETLTPKRKAIESPTGERIGGWEQDVNERESILHDTWKKMVGEDAKVYLKSTLLALKEMTTPTAGAEATTSGLLNTKIMDIRRRMVDDTGKPRSMPLNAIEDVRSLIGELTDPTMEVTISKGQANKLYGAIKSDVGEMVASKGDKVKAAYNDAFEYSRKKHEIVSSLMEPLRTAKIPEQAFTFATAGTPEGASQLRTLFQGKGEGVSKVSGLNKAEQDVVRSVMFRKLGGADAGEFSPTKFLANWNNMHNDAKEVLFGAPGSALRNHLDALNTVMLKSKSTATTIYELRNYAADHGMIGSATALAVLSGRHGMASILLSGLGAGAVAGRLIQRPFFVKWLTSASNKKPASIVPMLGMLAQKAATLPPNDQQDVKEYLANIQSITAPGGKQ
jgi:hypothetical protein